MSTNWAAFAKSYGKQYGLTYGQALAQAGPAWRQYLSSLPPPPPKEKKERPPKLPSTGPAPVAMKAKRQAKPKAMAVIPTTPKVVDMEDDYEEVTTTVVKKRKRNDQGGGAAAVVPVAQPAKKKRVRGPKPLPTPEMVIEQLEYIKSHPPAVKQEEEDDNGGPTDAEEVALTRELDARAARMQDEGGQAA